MGRTINMEYRRRHHSFRLLNNEQKQKINNYSETLMFYYNKENKYNNTLGKINTNINSLQNIKDNLLNFYDEPIIIPQKGIKGKIILFIKKIIRKTNYFLLKPYSEKIYTYQNINNETLKLMLDYLNSLEKEK